jgi:hypothetical protein
VAADPRMRIVELGAGVRRVGRESYACASSGAALSLAGIIVGLLGLPARGAAQAQTAGQSQRAA